MSKLRSLRATASTHARRLETLRRRRPLAEILEARTLLSLPIQVNTNADTIDPTFSNISLREAIESEASPAAPRVLVALILVDGLRDRRAELAGDLAAHEQSTAFRIDPGQPEILGAAAILTGLCERGGGKLLHKPRQEFAAELHLGPGAGRVC